MFKSTLKKNRERKIIRKYIKYKHGTHFPTPHFDYEIQFLLKYPLEKCLQNKKCKYIYKKDIGKEGGGV